MLEVTFYRDSQNRLSRIHAHGHAGAADRGEDIVCAAASAVLQAARLGLEEHARVALDAHQVPGSFRIEWPEAARDGEGVRAIVATAELAVEEISRQYPSHVRIIRASDAT
jgi:uncharacterized protein